MIYHLLAIIAESQPHFASLKQEKEQKSEEEQEQWFKEFLFERNSVERSELHRMRRKRELNFKNAGKILNSYCTYNEDKFTFEYAKHEEKHPNFFMKFRLRSRRGNFTNIPEAVFEYQAQADRKNYPFYLEKVLEFLFSTNAMQETYCRDWEAKCEEVKKNASIERLWKSFDLGYFYPLLLVCAHTLYPSHWSKNKIEEIIKTDIEMLKKYSSKKEGNIEVLLPNNVKQEKVPEKRKEERRETEVMIPQNPQPQREQTEGNSQKIMEKFVEKRQTRYEEMRKKRKEFLGLWNVKAENQEAQECLMCREKFGHQTDMVYMAKLSMNESFATSFHGQDDKSGICLETCHHAVHCQCFLTMKKNEQLELKCPLCSARCNAVLPSRITKKSQLVRQCENILNSLFVHKYKNLDFTSLLPLFFKHLISSLGLDSLTQPHLFEKTKNQRNKTNILIVTLLFDYLIAQGKEAVEELQEEYEAFMETVSSDSQLITRVQQFLAQIIFREFKCSG